MKIWAISDPHNQHEKLQVPEVDMVILAGDESNMLDKYENKAELYRYLDWFEALPIKYKVFIAGNHSTALYNMNATTKDALKNRGIHYLENSSITIEGIKIYGFPHSLKHGKYNAFQRTNLSREVSRIPLDTDILITHTPPKGILDLADGKYILEHVGCKNLLNRVLEVEPQFHIFGHVHEDGGKTQTISGCKTTFVNAAVLTPRHNFNNNGHILNYKQ